MLKTNKNSKNFLINSNLLHSFTSKANFNSLNETSSIPTLHKLAVKIKNCSNESLGYSKCVEEKGINSKQYECEKQFRNLKNCLKLQGK